MEFFDLTTGDDNVTLFPGFASPANGAPYAPGNAVRSLEGNDNTTGSEANDDINGNLGNDNVAGAGGDDFMRGGQGNDVVQGNDGNDQVNGNIGNDTVDGGGGNDVVRGGQNEDIINGGDGDDTIYGDIGVDTLTGGSGADVFVLQANRGTDIITDFRTEDSFGVIAGDLDVANLNITASGGDSLIVDKISGQTIAVVQGVDVGTVQSQLQGSTATRRLRVIADSGATAGGITSPSLNPTGQWSNASVTPGTGWSADGFITTTSESLVFSYKPDGNGFEQISLNIDPSNSGGLRFAASSYGYLLPPGISFIPIVEVPLVTTGNLLSANLTFADNNNAASLQGTLLIS
ncbi:calcium-binding protein [Pseudanabaena sp. PCC 6802]|uniref:calcium-binding protein n=1 Tax=Pseudanabaena sp. PCC 6802 TaxID=118173 RepID=UPI00034731DC|nr:calcium-binding protein [Pseudanabaena sp. PCC 6802]